MLHVINTGVMRAHPPATMSLLLLSSTLIILLYSIGHDGESIRCILAAVTEACKR